MEQRESSDTDAVVGDDHDSSLVEIVCQIVEVIQDHPLLDLWRVACSYRGTRSLTATEQRHERAKVGVSGNHHPVLIRGRNQERSILGLFETQLKRVVRIVTSFA